MEFDILYLLAVIVCICIVFAGFCWAENIVFGRDWWLPRLLAKICRMPPHDDYE